MKIVTLVVVRKGYLIFKTRRKAELYIRKHIREMLNGYIGDEMSEEQIKNFKEDMNKKFRVSSSVVLKITLGNQTFEMFRKEIEE